MYRTMLWSDRPTFTKGQDVRLWVDDERPAPEGWTVAKNYAQGRFLFEATRHEGFCIVEVSFDHDLGEGRTGYDLATWLEAEIAYGHIQAPETLSVHSANPVGRARIEQVIDSIRRLASRA